jgi:hypothetical protein
MANVSASSTAPRNIKLRFKYFMFFSFSLASTLPQLLPKLSHKRADDEAVVEGERRRKYVLKAKAHCTFGK